jgi:hypothetical protein
MHPVLHSWREELSGHFVRVMAYVGAVTLLSIAAAQFVQSDRSEPVKAAIAPIYRLDWIEIEKPFPAFDLSIPEAAGQPSSYAVRRHVNGSGRKDIMSLGVPDGVTPYLHVEIYRPGSEIEHFGDPIQAIEQNTEGLGPTDLRVLEPPLATKFGPMTVAAFRTTKGATRECLGFVRAYVDPLLRLSGWFCQGETLVRESTLACALDRLALLSAGSEPKVGAIFAQAELNRSFCGQRDPLLAATPKYHLLWKALANRSEPRRTGR